MALVITLWLSCLLAPHSLTQQQQRTHRFRVPRPKTLMTMQTLLQLHRMMKMTKMSAPRQPLLGFVFRVLLGMILTIHSRQAAASSRCASFGSVSAYQLAGRMRLQCFAAQLGLGSSLKSGRTWNRNQFCT
jgi:FtsH-binding integral membrane protein